MEVRKLIQKDRSAVSTIAVIAIVIILVIAAGAAYVLLIDEDKETEAPGTMMKYEIYTNDVLSETQEQKILGQNADSYFFVVDAVAGKQTYKLYLMDTKSPPKDMKQTGTTEMDTIDGRMTVAIWEYTKDGIAWKSYASPSTGVSYLHEGTQAGVKIKQVLVDYDLVMQTSYKQSKSIGTTYEYTMEVLPGYNYKTELKCVADCLDDQFGVKYDFSSWNGGELYFLSASPKGLPTDATDTKKTATLSTIDGSVTAQIWGLTIDESLSMDFYYDDDTQIVYRFVLKVAEGDLSFDLTKKPK